MSSISIDVRANTTKALNEFKKFSASLDNKFLISGLKLDVVRGALKQINNEFTKAVGEQSVTAGSGVRGAEKQMASLMSTFKGTSEQMADNMAKNYSTALSRMTATTGGTVKDINKSLGAITFFSQDLSADKLRGMAESLGRIQTYARQAGISENAAGSMKGFLSGSETPLDMMNQSEDTFKAQLGQFISKRAGTSGEIVNTKQRTELIARYIEEYEEQFKKAALEVGGASVIIDRLLACVFIPKAGLFGGLREITMQVDEVSTTVFDETTKLIDSVFGKQGFFLKFFAKVAEIFQIEDPLKLVIRGIRWITEQFKWLTDFLDKPIVQSVFKSAKAAVSAIVSFLQNVAGIVVGAVTSPQAQGAIQTVSGAVTEFFTGIATFIRSDEATTLIKKSGEIFTTATTRLAAWFTDTATAVGNVLGITKDTDGKLKGIAKILTQVLNALDSALKDPFVQKLGEYIKRVFTNVAVLARAIYDTTQGSSFDPEFIQNAIKRIGTDVRQFFIDLGKALREGGGKGAEKNMEGFIAIFKTLVVEIAKTIGTAIGEVIKLVFSPRGLAVLFSIGEVIYAGLSSLFEQIFGTSGAGKIISGLLAGGLMARTIINFVGKLLGGISGAAGGGAFGSLARATPGAVRGAPERARAAARGVRESPGMLRDWAHNPGRRGGGGGGGGSGGSGGGRWGWPGRGGRGGGGLSTGVTGKIGSPERLQFEKDVYDRAKTVSPSIQRGVPNQFDIDEARVNMTREARQRRANALRLKWASRPRLPKMPKMGGKAGLIGAGIAGAVGIGALFGGGSAKAGEMPKSEEQKAQDKESRGEIGGTIGSVAGMAIGGTLGAALGPVGAMVGSAIGAMVGEGVGKWAGQLDWGAIFGSVTATFVKIGGDMQKFADGIVSALVKWQDAAKKFVTETLPNTWKRGVDAIMSGLTNAWSAVKSAFETGKKTLLNLIPNGLKAFGENLVNGLKNIDAFGAVKSWFTGGQSNTAAPNAIGGSVWKGQRILVGEHGPEELQMAGNGHVVNNMELRNRKGGGGGTSVNGNFNVTINVNGGNGDFAQTAEFKAAVIAALDSAFNEVASTRTFVPQSV